MKDLDRSKVYDLSDLTKKRLKKLYKKLLKTENGDGFYMNHYDTWSRYLLFEENIGFYLINEITEIQQKYVTNALELFEEEEDNPNMSISWSNIDVKYERV